MQVDSLGKAEVRSSRLDSWKSIAVYLNRSLRTVQRWYEKYHLPIHRVGGNKGSIFAFTDELDRWMKHSTGETPIGEEPHPATDLSHSQQNYFSFGDLDESVSGAHRERSAKLVSIALRMWEQLSQDNIDLVVRTFQRAAALDPWNAYAASGLALSLITANLMEAQPPSSGYRSAREMTKRAIEIAPGLFETKICESWLKMVADHDWQSARIGFDSILEANGSCRYALVGRAVLYIAESRLQEASDMLIRSAELNPLSLPAAALHIWTEYLAGNYDRAIMLLGGLRTCGHAGVLLDALEVLVSLQFSGPDDQIESLESRAKVAHCPGLLMGILGYLYACAGQEKKARQVLDDLMKLEVRPRGQFAYPMALILTELGDHQRAIEALEKSYARGSIWSFGFLSDPLLESLRNSPHFQDFQPAANYPM